ncbi:hypothetical protein RF11_13721 [Thelohanellus kitauei]|uniref:Uncharacterized protein n=1 Tax=Thelohanellus kitauei TaxID=669202 RepID=A0A0C2N9Z5_THEKT|nr:hypothetical protein RF11_13721 [Thelohanellus kitauei]
MANPSDYPRLTSSLFLDSRITQETFFPKDFRDVIEMIVNIPPDTPSSLVEKFCKSLRDLIDHLNHLENIPDMSSIALDSIYKWLAQIPGPASKIIQDKHGYGDDVLDEILSDTDVRNFLNSISITLCCTATKLTRSRVLQKLWQK